MKPYMSWCDRRIFRELVAQISTIQNYLSDNLWRHLWLFCHERPVCQRAQGAVLRFQFFQRLMEALHFVETAIFLCAQEWIHGGYMEDTAKWSF